MKEEKINRTHTRKIGWWLTGAGVALIGAIAWSAQVGVVHFSWNEMWQSPIFWNLRLPRIVLCVLVGAVLSVSGAAYQSIFRNPLTDPYILGVSSGASLGAAVAILIGLENYAYGVGGCALMAALLTVLAIYHIASIGNRMHTSTLLLTGVCFTFLITAIISFLMVLHQDKMESIIFWTMGSFASASWNDVILLTPIAVVGMCIVRFYAKDLNLLLAGSESAKSMGVEVEKVKRALLLVTTLMVAFAVSTCGVIGFVGLVVPHCVRIITGADNRKVIPLSILSGGLLMVMCDTLARTILPPSELPVGSLTALIGAPLFIYLLYRNKRGC